MKLRKLSFKNFKSYSNIMTEISFDSKSSLNLIVGDNGTGKTSIAECATYLLYGKLENFNASDIPNRINKNFYGKIELDCDGHSVIIERGLNPSLFRVQIDNEVVDTAGKSNVQTFLEETYFKIPYTVFHNVLVLEVGEVKSLLDMSAADKRNIIDKICGFTVYNEYSKIVKEKAKVFNDDLNANYASIRTMNSTIEQYERQIEEIKENAISQDEIDELTNKLNEAKEMKAKNDEMLQKIRLAGEKIKLGNTESAGEYKILQSKIQEIDKKIALIDGGKCPTCGSSLDTEDFLKERDELVSKREEYINRMNKIKEIVKGTQSKLSALDKKEQDIRKSNNQMGIADIQADLKYKITLKNKSTDNIESMKKKLLLNLKELESERERLEDDKKTIDFLVATFSDSGIKRYISNKYIPMINSLMKEMLQYMNLNYSVIFNNNFDAEIMQNGLKVKYPTLSKGEKRRVDFAAVISFIKFLKLQFGELNLLFLDEIFSNVDINGVSDMIEILRGLCESMNLNIYLIHHARLEGIMFDNILHTIKEDGFSKIIYG